MAMRNFVTEFIGTFFLVFTIGMAVTAPTSSTLLQLAIGAGLMSMVYMGGHISGAHYNPAVSLAILIRGKMTLPQFVIYVIVQLVASIVAGFVVAFIAGPKAIFIVQMGKETGVAQALLAEFLFTYALALTVLNVATAPKNAGNSFYGLAIGFIVLAGAVCVGGISGGAFNPAVGTGPNLVAMMSGHAGAMRDVWIYWVAPLAAGLLAGITANFQNAEADKSASAT